MIMVADKIKSIRLSLGLSMEEFGKKFDSPASKGVVSNWENNYNLPNHARLKRIAELGNTTVEELLSERVPNQFHKKLKQLRIEKGLTQKRLGELVNKKESTVRMWELDKNEPTLSTLIRLADIFDVTLDELVGMNKR